jgi:hypothetical protein
VQRGDALDALDLLPAQRTLLPGARRHRTPGLEGGQTPHDAGQIGLLAETSLPF